MLNSVSPKNDTLQEAHRFNSSSLASTWHNRSLFSISDLWRYFYEKKVPILRESTGF